jgi:hypothetical protein
VPGECLIPTALSSANAARLGTPENIGERMVTDKMLSSANAARLGTPLDPFWI